RAVPQRHLSAFSTRRSSDLGIYADGSMRDLTPFSTMSPESPGVAAIQADGLVTPEKEGETVIRIQAGGQTVGVPVRVTNLSKPRSEEHTSETPVTVASRMPS